MKMLDHSVWAVRPEVLATIERLMRADVAQADLRKLFEEGPQGTAEARMGMAMDVDSSDLTRVGSVAILSLTGLIQPRSSFLSWLLFGSGGSLQMFRAELRAALADDSIEAILLHIDSPGGKSSLVEETATELRAAREVKPIIAIANTMACSAAHWIGSQATEFVVTPSGYVGSIGVYYVHTDFSGLNAQLGLKVTYVFTPEHKVDANEDNPLSDDAKKDLQADVDAIYGRFIRDVALGRKVDQAKVGSDFGVGRVLNAGEALAAGAVDRVETFEGALGGLLDQVDPATAASALGRARAAAPPADPQSTAPAAEAADAEPESDAAAEAETTPPAAEPDADDAAEPEAEADDHEPDNSDTNVAAEIFDVLTSY